MSQKYGKGPKDRGGGGVRAENKKIYSSNRYIIIIQNADYSGFSYFSQIQMTEIWSWFWGYMDIVKIMATFGKLQEDTSSTKEVLSSIGSFKKQQEFMPILVLF